MAEAQKPVFGMPETGILPKEPTKREARSEGAHSQVRSKTLRVGTFPPSIRETNAPDRSIGRSEEETKIEDDRPTITLPRGAGKFRDIDLKVFLGEVETPSEFTLLDIHRPVVNGTRLRPRFELEDKTVSPDSPLRHFFGSKIGDYWIGREEEKAGLTRTMEMRHRVRERRKNASSH